MSTRTHSSARDELRQTRDEIDALCAEIFARCRDVCPELFDRLDPLLLREKNLQAIALLREEITDPA